MRKALIVGIDYYDTIGPLSGCVNDALSVKMKLERNFDESKNFGVRLITSGKKDETLTTNRLRCEIEELFNGDSDIALLYFAGHGFIDETGGYICSSNSETGNDGIKLNDIIIYANNSKSKNKIIILDSCHSGSAGNSPSETQIAAIKDGVTIMTASTGEQYAMGNEKGGVFTNLFVDALDGAAANLLGHVTPGGIYAHIDQSLGEWGQRPVFKTNVKSFISLRKAQPPISLKDLQKLTDVFLNEDYQLPLDPSFEPERNKEQNDDINFPKPDKEKTIIFALLQRYVKVNLVRPVGEIHMWHAAMNYKSCKLTVLGQHYWNLVKNELI